jgi:hypothetical protein
MRLVAMLTSFVGLFLCLGAAGTGIYWGVFNKSSMEWRTIHLNFAISCVFVSLFAHAFSIHFLRKHKS